MANKVLVVVYKRIGFTFQGCSCEEEAVNIDNYSLTSRSELPIRGCVDFTIYNLGTTNAFIFGNIIKIPPGTSWSPPKSSTAPIANQPIITFDGDYQNTRNIADAGNGSGLSGS